MASNWSLCGVCETLGTSIPSIVWCSNCDETLCVNCRKQHMASKETEPYQLTPIEIYRRFPTVVLKMSKMCPEHNEKYETYCVEHELVCCIKCALTKHDECNMLSVDAAVDAVKFSNALVEVEEILKENTENVTLIIKDRKLNLSSVQQENIMIQTKIRKTKIIGNEHLDETETQILHELSKLEELHTSKIQMLVLSLEKKKEIEGMQESLSVLKDHASDVQILNDHASDLQILKDHASDLQGLKDHASDLQILKDHASDLQILKDHASDLQILKNHASDLQILKDHASDLQIPKDHAADLQIPKDHASDQQIFLLMKRMEKHALADDEFLKSLCSSGDLNHISLFVELYKTIQNIENRLPTFGRVLTSSNTFGVVLKKGKHKQPQYHIPMVRSIDRIRLYLIKFITGKQDITGGCFLPDGRFAVVTRNFVSRCIELMTEDGTVHSQINVSPYEIIGLTHIPSTNILAVTTRKKINIINMDTKNTIRSISSSSNFGITFKDGCLIYCADRVGICKMNINSEKVTVIKKIPNMPRFSYIATYQDKLYYTNKDIHTVTCCGIDGTTKWVFMDEKVLCGPRGICVDNYGNVFVVGRNTNNLIVISPDGDRHSVLITVGGVSKIPAIIDFDRITNRILWTNGCSDLFLYKVN